MSLVESDMKIASNDDFHFAVAMMEAPDSRVRALATRVASAMAPTSEIGLQRNAYGPAGNRTSTGPLGWDLGWANWVDTKEYVPDLKWPRSVKVFDMMRTDSQLSGLYRAMTYPIRRYKWMIDPNGARDEVVQGVANDLNLDIQGQDPRPRGRTKKRFSFDEYLYHALLALIYGYMCFEQVGEIGSDGLWHLRKLAPRMPETIYQINVAEDGGLISVRQNLTRFDQPGMFNGTMGPEIPVDRLVWFSWEKEGPNWPGRSIFRDAYRNWLIKDRLLRVDAINHERAGGVPIAEAPVGATPSEMERLNQLAQQFKVGEHSGGSVPAGTNFQLHRVGANTDVVNSIKYHDESMARMFLHMFIQLGQTETGSRALGMSFIEYAFIAQNAIAAWFVGVTNGHVIEDWVDWNYGENEQVPLLTYIVEEEDEHLAVKDLVAMVHEGIITVDEAVEDQMRERYRIAPRSGPRPDPTPPVTSQLPPDGGPVPLRAIEALRMNMLEQYDRIQFSILKNREEMGGTIKTAIEHMEENNKKIAAQVLQGIHNLRGKT